MTISADRTRDFTRLSDEQLLQFHYEHRDGAARDQLVMRFMPLARKLALRYVHTSEPLADLVQVACIGLLNAVDRFEPGRGKTFTAYAVPTIVGELKRHFRDKGWTVHVPRDLKERALAASRHSERLSSELGRAPTLEELCTALDCTVEQAIEAVDAAHNYHPASLDAPAAHEEDDSCPLAETLGADDNGFDLAEERQSLLAGWQMLTDVEREVLGLRLGQGLTQRQISERIGCSQMHVSRLLRKSFLRLELASESAAPA
jgi:RNA polymerase sigma-B factor